MVDSNSICQHGYRLRKCPPCDALADDAEIAALGDRVKELEEALGAMLSMHIRESGHRNGECANCFVARAVLAKRKGGT